MVRYMCNSPHFNKTSRPEGLACFVCITFWDSNPARGFELPLERVCAWAVRAKHPSGSTKEMNNFVHLLFYCRKYLIIRFWVHSFKQNYWTIFEPVFFKFNDDSAYFAHLYRCAETICDIHAKETCRYCKYQVINRFYISPLKQNGLLPVIKI